MADEQATSGSSVPAVVDISTRQQHGVSIHRQRDESMAQAFTGLIPSSTGEALQLAQALARAGDAIPKVYRGNPEAIFVVIMAGMEMGLTPLRSMQGFVPIGGNLAMKADLQLAQVRRSGALEYFDEGFELCGETDGNLADRIPRAGRDDREREELRLMAETVLDLVASVPEGKPYGWAISQRKGDRQKHVRVFTFVDAENFKTTAWEDGKRVEGKLSEKAAYKNNPQDMYPKRARVRVLPVTHSDVLMGMPAVEAMDGVEDEHQNGAATPTPTSTEDTVLELLTRIEKADQALAKAIRDGFGLMEMGPARRLQLLRKYDGKPKDLGEFLRDEYANRKNGGKGRASKQAGPNEGSMASHAWHAAVAENTTPVGAQETKPSETEPATTGTVEEKKAETGTDATQRRGRRRF